MNSTASFVKLIGNKWGISIPKCAKNEWDVFSWITPNAKTPCYSNIVEIYDLLVVATPACCNLRLMPYKTRMRFVQSHRHFEFT